jgi:predicted DNA-binding transcriptional regulator AlpA
VHADETVPATSNLLTLPEAAAFLRTPIATLRYWRHLGTGPRGFRLGRRVMFRREDLERWLTDQIGAEAFRR